MKKLMELEAADENSPVSVGQLKLFGETFTPMNDNWTTDDKVDVMMIFSVKVSDRAANVSSASADEAAEDTASESDENYPDSRINSDVHEEDYEGTDGRQEAETPVESETQSELTEPELSGAEWSEPADYTDSEEASAVDNSGTAEEEIYGEQENEAVQNDDPTGENYAADDDIEESILSELAEGSEAEGSDELPGVTVVTSPLGTEVPSGDPAV